MSLSGHVALVTGASRERGIGAAVCRALAAAGATFGASRKRRFSWLGSVHQEMAF